VSIFEIIVLIIAGILTGFVNTLAGGGSIISLSVLLFFGLPPALANGTNRVAIFMQTLVASGSYRHQRVLDLRKGLVLAIPSVLGSIIGAEIASDINEDIFEKAIALIMLIMMFFILYKPGMWVEGRPELVGRKVSVKQHILFFLIGIYGGFIHIGIGYFLLAGLVMSCGYNILKANALKVFIVLLSTPFTLMVFLYHGQVDWKYGLVMAIGNILGAFVAARMAVKRGANFVRWVIIVVILITSIDLLGIYDIREIIQSLL
jgi:hypothetical protein